MERVELMNALYAGRDGRTEDTRLARSRHGQLEYLTTMHYIHKLVPAGSKVLEVGAGTGKYAVALAGEGFDVTAVELVESNLEIMRRNAAGLGNIVCRQGDAVDLSAFGDDSFDAVLLLGPMYHLFDRDEQMRALDEAIRVTRPGGVLMAAFLSVWQLMYNNYFSGNFRAGLEENFDSQLRVRHFQEQGFTGFDIAEFEGLFPGKPVEKLALVGTDGQLELAEESAGFSLSDEEFGLFAEYHLKSCEKRELLGANSHLLYIGRKLGEPGEA